MGGGGSWDDYLRSAGLRTQTGLDSGHPCADESAERRLRIRRGEVLVAPLVDSNNGLSEMMEN